MHPEFKVILIANKLKISTQMYDQSLLNRFEKQFLNPDDILDERQRLT